jgi:type II secretory pathway component GspD/PulD (secretin)
MKPVRLTTVLLCLASAVSAQDAKAPAPQPQDAKTPAPQQQDSRVAQERAREDLLAQKTFLLVERHLANARADEERFDLQAAERELLEARDLDPTNKVVQDTLAQIQTLMGKPEAEARSLSVSAAQRYAAQQQQMKIIAEQDLAQAEKLMVDGDAREAERITRSVINRIQWSSKSTDWGDVAPRAQADLQRATAAAGGQADAERQKRESEAYAKLQEEERSVAGQSDARHDSMLASAWDRYLAHDFDGAMRLAQAVLDEDKNNPGAQETLDAARDAQRQTRSEKFLRDRAESFARWHESMEAVRVPTDDVLTPPDKARWAQITALRGGGKSLGLASPDPENDALRERLLTTHIDADYKDLTLEQVANQIFITTEIPISVDPEVKQDLDSAAVYVNLSNLRDIPVQSLLNILVEQTGQGLAWTIRNGRVYITKTEKAAEKPVPRVHDIQDLTFPITDFKGVNIRDIPLPGEAGDDNTTTVFTSELEKVKLIEPDEVVNLVRENIARESWDSGQGYSIALADSQNLLVIHTPAVQRQVADFLDDLRSYATSMVTLEARFYALTDAFIEEIGTDLRGLGPTGNSGTEFPLNEINPVNSQGLDNSGDGTGAPKAGFLFQDTNTSYGLTTEHFFGNPLGKLLTTVGGGAFQFAILNNAQVNLVMHAIEKSQNAFEISSPIVSVYNTQRAYVTVVNQVSFVQGYDVDVANAAFIADPNIGVVQEGIVLDVRPTISFDRKYVTLDVQTTVANLTRPMRSVTTNLGGNSTEVSFSLPQLDVQDAQTTVVVPDGGSVLLGGFKHVLYRNRTAEAPFLADIPVLGFFFQDKGLADEMTDLIIMMKATISDFSKLRHEPVAQH